MSSPWLMPVVTRIRVVDRAVRSVLFSGLLSSPSNSRDLAYLRLFSGPSMEKPHYVWSRTRRPTVRIHGAFLALSMGEELEKQLSLAQDSLDEAS